MGRKIPDFRAGLNVWDKKSVDRNSCNRFVPRIPVGSSDSITWVALYSESLKSILVVIIITEFMIFYLETVSF
jgi:hypothetical protein